MERQLDIYDCLAVAEAEAAYAHAEREGMRLNDVLCADCPTLDACIAREGCAHGE